MRSSRNDSRRSSWRMHRRTPNALRQARRSPPDRRDWADPCEGPPTRPLLTPSRSALCVVACAQPLGSLFSPTSPLNDLDEATFRAQYLSRRPVHRNLPVWDRKPIPKTVAIPSRPSSTSKASTKASGAKPSATKARFQSLSRSLVDSRQAPLPSPETVRGRPGSDTTGTRRRGGTGGGTGIINPADEWQDAQNQINADKASFWYPTGVGAMDQLSARPPAAHTDRACFVARVPVAPSRV